MADEQKSQDSKSILLEAGAAAIQKLYQGYLMRIKAGESLSRSEIKAFRELEKELKGPEEAPSLPGYNEAAEYLGISTRMLKWHRGKGNLRQNPDGSFDRDELDRFISKHGKRKQDKDLAQKRLMADLRYRLARATKEEILVSQLRGELYPMSEIAEGWAFRVSEITAALQSLIDRLPPVLVGKERLEIQEVISQEVYDIRERFARNGRFTPVASA